MANPAEPGTMGGAAAEHAAPARRGSAAFGDYASGDPASLGATAAFGGTELDLAEVNEAHGGTANPSFHGRTISWAAVSLIMVAFLVSGFAMVFGTGGPIWWLFYVGVGLAAVGLLIMMATKTFEDWY